MIDAKIRELAEQLGAAMADAPAVKKFKQLRQEAMADPDAQTLMKGYQDHLDQLAKKEQEHRPIEVEDKQKLRDFQEKIYRNEKLKAFVASQANYVELVHTVNDLMGKYLVGNDEETK